MNVTLPSEVLRVLDDAFGRDAVEDVAALRGGRSGAKVYAVRTAGGSFVVRVPDPSRVGHELRSERELGCMAVAAERGIGPALHHADRSTGVTVSVHVEDVLDGPARALVPDRIPRLAGLLRRLHDGPSLPGDGNLPSLLGELEANVRARGASLPSALLSTVREASNACLRFGQRSPCHNDLNPGNILETADRAYLVDWEIAGWGDPFVDLAQVGVFGLRQADARDELLARYLGREPDAQERAHATLARVVALGVYAAGFTAVAAFSGEGPLEAGTAAQTFDEVVAELARGRARSLEVATALSERTRSEAASDDYRAAIRVAFSLDR